MEDFYQTHALFRILTNPSFKECVKIGYADNVENRLTLINKKK